MGNSTWRARARLHNAWRRVAAVAGLSLVASMTALAPAQAGLLGDVTDTVTNTTGSIPIVGDVTDPVGDLLDEVPLDEVVDEGAGEVLDPVTGDITNELGEVVKKIDPTSGVVTDALTGEVLGVLDPVTGDLLLSPLPGISGDGAGQLWALVDGALTEVCSSTDDLCEQLPIEKMVDEAAIILKAVPANPEDLATWDPATCPTIIADICFISVDDLAQDTPLKPIVSFLGGAGTPGAPDTEITSPVPGKQSTTHTFTFEADPSTEQTTFECKLEVAYKSTPPTGSQTSHDWQACGTDPFGSHTYPRKFANGTYVFAVQALEGDVADDTPATQTWTVAVPPEVPETRISTGPKNRGFVVTPRAIFRFRSTVEGSRFQCWYDDLTNACDNGRFVWRPRMLKPGQHTFKVAAMAGKTQDFTPARRTFNVPLDDRALRPVKAWQRKKQKGHLRNTFSLTQVKGAALVTRKPQKFRRVVLVADKGRGFGTVKVFKGKQLLREVNLHAKKKLVKRKVIPVKRFRGKLRAGKIRVVVTSAGKPVRIDGIGVARR